MPRSKNTVPHVGTDAETLAACRNGLDRCFFQFSNSVSAKIKEKTISL